MLDKDYKDFRAYRLLDDGEKEELDVEVEQVPELFSSEGVLLLVRYDLRRLFIWKGPRSPVRQRFISSRVGSQIQDASAKEGVHLKIVSVDAGDEPIEFLKAFKCDPYEVSDDEKPEDMYYIRNDERRKLEEEELARKLKEKKSKKEKKGYWSPALAEIEGDQKTAKEKALEKAKRTTPTRTAPVRTAPKRTTSIPQSRNKNSISTLGDAQVKHILDEILKLNIPKGYQRLNIIIGTNLYGPQKIIAKVFGKEVEQIKWDKIKEIPEGNIEIEAQMMRAYCKDNQVLGMEVFKKENGNSESAKASSNTSENKQNDNKNKKDSDKENTKADNKRRELPPIPRGE